MFKPSSFYFVRKPQEDHKASLLLEKVYVAFLNARFYLH